MLVAAFHTVLTKASFGRFGMSGTLPCWLITHCKRLRLSGVQNSMMSLLEGLQEMDSFCNFCSFRAPSLLLFRPQKLMSESDFQLAV